VETCIRTVKGLAISDVAEQTGLAAGTIRVWEQRYGFPEPARTPSGYRIYQAEDVEILRRVVAYRDLGLSVPTALERARAAGGSTDRPSLFGAIVTAGEPVQPQRLRKSTLFAISRAIEDETLARGAGPIVIGAFQDERNYRGVEHRYRRLARVADACVAFGSFAEVSGGDGEPVLLPVTPGEALGAEWAVVVDAPGYAACLLAWETPESQRDSDRDERERCFEAVWTLDPSTVRRAALVGSSIARRTAPEVGARLEELLQDRPLAVESPAPALTALTNRIVGYLD
jgi:MerR family transcriptional regulator, light-induced transcriptional regulator